MKLQLFNIDEYCKTLPAIESQKAVDSGKFMQEGLFSQQIFGPLKSYTCACNRGTYRGRYFGKINCNICGVDITSSNERRKRYARIELPFEIMNPTFLYLVNRIKPSLKTIIQDMLYYNYKYIYTDGMYKKIQMDEPIAIEIPSFIGLEGSINLLIQEIDFNKDDNKYMFLAEHIDLVTIKNVIVIPPDFRPCSNDGRLMDKINLFYRQIIRKCNRIYKLPFKITTNMEIYRSTFKYIQKETIDLYDYILEKLSKKKGTIRSNILGKRVDFSGRAVITPDPTLKVNECRISYHMLLEMLKPQLSAYIVQRRICKYYNMAVKLIESEIKNRSFEYVNYIKEYVDGKYCLLNRQPTLYRLGALGLKIKVGLDHTIKISPLICSVYNADFDGDSIYCAVFVGINKEGHIENKEIHISEILSLNIFEHKSEKIKDNNIKITKYNPTDEIYIKSINTEDGNINWKKITEYSIHENIDMYKLHDSSNRFEDFWSSYDHSLIIYDDNTNSIRKVTPIELIDNPDGKYLIKDGIINGI